MFNILKIKKMQGRQYIKDIKNADISNKHKGLPVIKIENCSKDCLECSTICPTDAISLNPFQIDLGKCIFCGDCENICSKASVIFTSNYKIAQTNRSLLNIKAIENNDNDEQLKNDSMKIFKRSFKLRSVSAAGCNGCEMEINACSNVNFDFGRFGIDIVASPRHADGIIITGPISINMADALEDAYNSIPEPKIIILAGACAISGGLFADSTAINRSFLDKYKISLYIPGCPIHPLTVVNGILRLLQR